VNLRKVCPEDRLTFHIFFQPCSGDKDIPSKLIVALFGLTVIFSGLSLPTPAVAQSHRIDHQIGLSNRKNQYVSVSSRIPVNSEELELILPVWTPGPYLIRDFSAHVENFRARGKGGVVLPVRKTAKNRWLVTSGDEQEVVVEYSVWAGELAVNASWVEKDFAILNGASVFMYSESSRSWPQAVKIDLPVEWEHAYSAMLQLQGGSGFLAQDYDDLVDSPLLLGNGIEYPFKVSDQDYVLINQGESSLWDGERSSKDLSVIVETVQKFWEVNPFDRPYYFMNIIAQGSGGLEHDNSTVLLTGSWQMRYREDYVRWLALATHEFFHSWNVRRLRPAALSQYDYQQEVYTRELWIAEGLTSYYDNLLLLRSGLITVDEFFTLLAREFHKVETTPGRLVRSAELASFDTWIKHYKPDANSVNSVVSYYGKGAMIGFVTDAAIRRNSKNKQSLDTLMREMYLRYGPDGTEGVGYPPGAFQNLVQSLSSVEIRNEVDELLSSTSDPDIDSALKWYGLQLDRAPAKSAADASGGLAPAGFGVVWNKDSEDLAIEAVLSGSSGAQAGILPGDELLAINGFRVTKDNISDRMLRLLVGENTKLLLVRHEKLLSLTVTLQDAVPDKYQISIRPDISSRQKERMTAWLGIKLHFVSR
jgi:predicted metalloprotease with PDZ domain